MKEELPEKVEKKVKVINVPLVERVRIKAEIAVIRTKVLNKVRAGKPLDSTEQEVFEKAKCEFEKRGLNIPGL
jgi:hypothetical protein